MSSSVSVERRKMIRAFGARLILTSPEKGTDGAIEKAKELAAKKPGEYFMPNQFSNKNNWLAHYHGTGREIWLQMGGKVDFFVASLGTSGTLMGVSRFLKEKDSSVKVVAAHPEKGHGIQGLKNLEEAVVPEIYDASRIDEIIEVKTGDALECARLLARKEGIFAGMSSGAALYSALRIAGKNPGARIAVLFPDRGEKYLSTVLFE